MSKPKVPTFWVSHSKGGARLAQDFPGGYGPGERAGAEAKARARLDELRADPGATGVRLELHDPDVHSGRDATTTLYAKPEG